MWKKELYEEDKIIFSNTLQLIDLRGLEDGHFITSIGHCPQLKQLLIRRDCGLLRGGSSMIFSSFMMQNQHLKKFVRLLHSNSSSRNSSYGCGNSRNSHSNSTTAYSTNASIKYREEESHYSYSYLYLSPPYNVSDDIQTPIIASGLGRQQDVVGGLFEGMFSVIDKLDENDLYGIRYCTLPCVVHTKYMYVLVFVKLDLLQFCPQARLRQFVTS
jgi:hypothetical protein